MQAFNQLTPGEDERLSILAEECAEVIMAIMKIKRHGYQSKNPLYPNPPTNRETLEKEIGHVRHAIGMLLTAGDVNHNDIEHWRARKAKDIRNWVHHQEIK